MKEHLKTLKRIIGQYLKSIGGDNSTYITGGVLANRYDEVSCAYRLRLPKTKLHGECFKNTTPNQLLEMEIILHDLIKNYLIANSLLEVFFEHKYDEESKIADMRIIIIQNSISENVFSW